MNIIEKNKKIWKEHKTEIIMFSGSFIVGSIFSVALYKSGQISGAQKGFTTCNELFNNMIEDTLSKNPEIKEKFTDGFIDSIQNNIKNGKLKIFKDGTLKCSIKV